MSATIVGQKNKICIKILMIQNLVFGFFKKKQNKQTIISGMKLHTKKYH